MGLLVLAGVRRQAPRSPPERPVEIEIVQVEPTPPPKPEGGKTTSERDEDDAGKRVASGRRGGSFAKGGRPGGGAGNRSSEGSAPQIAAEAEPSGGREGTIEVVEPEEPLPLRRDRDLELFPLPTAPSEGQEPPGQVVAVEPEGRRIEKRLEELFAEDRAVETAKNRADPYWFDLRRRLEREFSVPLDLVEDGPGNGTLGLQGAIDTYRAQAKAYANSGNPHGDGPLVPGSRRGMAQELRDELAEGVFGEPLAEAIGDRSLFSRELVTVVELEQASDGSILDVRLITKSGSPGHDQIALDHMRTDGAAAASDLGAPPAQGRRTRWAFTSSLWIVPPLPMVGCGFDAQFMPTTCVYPLKKNLKHRVRLLAIYERPTR
ncbi:hypothetical protein [Vulgatibacter incomptus]|uniref:hypothetical protein n=1 Tax=Vulgatibacter incomptus TaxID=1391653 RepID=UPI0012F9658D|nr:hypothetical protein [Vulgatibacter incomptus]